MQLIKIMDDFKKETRDLQKEINNRTNEVKDQNKKMYEIDDKFYQIDDELKDSERYQKGIEKGFWAFIPNLFKSKKKTKRKENYKDEAKIKHNEEMYAEKKKVIVKDDKDKDYDELMNEINGMKLEANELKNEVKQSNQIADDMYNHVNYTNAKLIQCNDKNKRILKK